MNNEVLLCKTCGGEVDTTGYSGNETGKIKCVCKYCGNVNFFDVNKEDETLSYTRTILDSDLSEVYSLLEKIKYEEAENKIDLLKQKYPDESEIYFLSVLAQNGISYSVDITDESEKKRRIPTLNHVSFTKVSELDDYKHCLELATDDERKNYYLKQFNYIERVRDDIIKASKSKDYQYDIFISYKKTLVDENYKEITGPNGPLETADSKIARDIYQFLLEQRKYKVFFAERTLHNAAGSDYEKVIFSALQSSKIFILVGTSSLNLNAPWVANEWRRYLKLKDDPKSNKKKNSLLICYQDMNPVNFPTPLKKIQAINSSTRNFTFELDNNIKAIMSSYMEIGTIDIKTEDVKVKTGTIDSSKIKKIDLETIELNNEIIELSEDLNVDIDMAERYLLASKFEQASTLLKDVIERNDKAYKAKNLLLLADKRYKSYDEYFSSFDKVCEDKRFLETFFKEVDKNMALEGIQRLLKLYKSNVYTYNENIVYIDRMLIKLIDNIDKKTDLVDLKNNIELLGINRVSIDIIKDSLDIDNYINNGEPNAYIEARKRIINSLYNLEDYNTIYYVIGKLCDEILSINMGESFALLNKLLASYECTNLEKLEKKSIRIVKNKNFLLEFNNIIEYSSVNDVKNNTYALLSMIINDKNALQTQNDVTIGKEIYELNQYDLFMHYIKYSLPDIRFSKDTSILTKEWYYHPDKDFFKLEETNSLLSLISGFACGLHINEKYDEAEKMYNLFIAQHGSNQSTMACIFANYYIALCRIRACDKKTIMISQASLKDVKEFVIAKKLMVKVNSEMFDELIDIEDKQDHSSKYCMKLSKLIEENIAENDSITIDNEKTFNECDGLIITLKEIVDKEIIDQLLIRKYDYFYKKRIIDEIKNKLIEINGFIDKENNLPGKEYNYLKENAKTNEYITYVKKYGSLLNRDNILTKLNRILSNISMNEQIIKDENEKKQREEKENKDRIHREIKRETIRIVLINIFNILCTIPIGLCCVGLFLNLFYIGFLGGEKYGLVTLINDCWFEFILDTPFIIAWCIAIIFDLAIFIYMEVDCSYDDYLRGTFAITVIQIICGVLSIIPILLGLLNDLSYVSGCSNETTDMFVSGYFFLGVMIVLGQIIIPVIKIILLAKEGYLDFVKDIIQSIKESSK